jgi:tetratricopeptide (TPR) repeat protein
MNIRNIKFPVRVLGLLLLACLLFVNGHAQEKLGKKEKKTKEKETLASRLFIEGQKFLMLEEYEKAYFYFDKALQYNPDEGAIYYKLAEMMLKANNQEKALEYGHKALESDPDNKYYHLLIAEIYSKQQKNKEAAEVLQALMDRDDDSPQYILELASLYLSSQEFDKALDALDQAEEHYGVVEPLTAQKQRIYLRKNDLESAIREGEKLIEAHPGNSQYVLALVEILFNNNRLDDALDLVHSSLEAYPNQPELQMAAYTLYKQKGDIDESRKYIVEAFENPDLNPDMKARGFAEVLQEMRTSARDSLLDRLSGSMARLHPNDPDVLAALGDHELSDNNKGKALEYYLRSIDLQPKNEPVLQSSITLSFELQKPYGEIETLTSLALDEFPKKTEFWFFDGTSKLGQKKYEEAKNSLEKALELNGGKNKHLEMMIYGQLGDTYHYLDKKEDAYAAYEKVLAYNPNNEHILNNYAYFLSLEKKDLEKAKKMSEKLVRKYPENATYLDTHAWVLFQMENFNDAREYMEKALAYQTTPSGVMYEHYGDILYKLGEKDEALKYWNKAKDLEDTSEFLTLKIKNKRYYE